MALDPVQLLAATLTVGVIISYPSLGEAFSELSGVYNLGLEGIMLISAATSFIGALFTGNVAVGLLVGIMTGVLLGAVQALFAVHIGADQVVFGLGIILLGPFLSTFLASSALKSGLRQAPIFPPLDTTGFPYPLNFILRQNALFFILFILAFVLWFLLFKTRFGLALRSVGENAHVAASAGINVSLVRYVSSIIGSTIAAIGGTFVILGLNGLWSDNITGGRGFIAIAIVRVGLFKPILILVFSLLFGLVDSFQLYQAAVLGPSFPHQFLSMAPFLIGIFALLISTRFKIFSEPTALGTPYIKEQR